MDAHPKLTIEAIIRWEQMTGRSFATIDLSEDRDMRRLLYCSTVVGIENPVTFGIFERMLENGKVNNRLRREFSSRSEFVAQFVRRQKTQDAAGTGANQTGTIASIAARLIITGGMDAHFVMRELFIEDLPMYIDALNDRIHHELESMRLWTYLQVLPHVNGRKISSPKKLFTFPWEKEEEERKARESIERDEQQLRDFLSGKMFDPNKIKWTSREDANTIGNHGKE